MTENRNIRDWCGIVAEDNFGIIQFATVIRGVDIRGEVDSVAGLDAAVKAEAQRIKHWPKFNRLPRGYR